MKVYELIKILANVCKYNAEGKVYIRVNGVNIPIDHCEDDGCSASNDRILVFVPNDN